MIGQEKADLLIQLNRGDNIGMFDCTDKLGRPSTVAEKEIYWKIICYLN
jgi:hypothetical protein